MRCSYSERLIQTHPLLPCTLSCPLVEHCPLLCRAAKLPPRAKGRFQNSTQRFLFIYLFFLFVWCCVRSKDGGTYWTCLKMESGPVIPKATTGLSWSQFASWSKCTCKLSRPHEVNLHACPWEAQSEGKSWDWPRVKFVCGFIFALSFLLLQNPSLGIALIALI